MSDNESVHLSALKASAEMSKPTPGSGRPASTQLAKRFYKEVSVVAEGEGFTIQLDGKPVRTPARNALLLPTNALADAIAAEWHAQAEMIDKSTMPLMALACIALDVATSNANGMRDELLEYASTDQLCYREPEGRTAEAQIAHYDPLLAWASTRYGAVFETTTGIYPIPQSDEALRAVGKAIAVLDHWQLAAASVTVGITRSLVMALAMIEKHIDAEHAYFVAALEETTQAEQWGMDEEQQTRLDAWKRDLDAVGLLLGSVHE